MSLLLLEYLQQIPIELANAIISSINLHKQIRVNREICKMTLQLP